MALSIISPADALNRFLRLRTGISGSSAASPIRIPWTFTSTLRRRIAANQQSAAGLYAAAEKEKALADESFAQFLASPESSGVAGSMGLAPGFLANLQLTRSLGYSQSAVALSQQAYEASLSYAQYSMAKLQPFITMAINPNSVKFAQPKRFQKVDVQEGSVFFHFSNRKGQNNDILTITFSGSTGNLDLRGSLGSAYTSKDGLNSPDAAREEQQFDTGALQKLFTWHNLYQLTREPVIFGNNYGIENETFITIASSVFPLTIEFTGFFNKVLEFEENADSPNIASYDAEFTVTRSEPDLDDVSAEIFDIMQDASVGNLAPGATWDFGTEGGEVAV